jgi:hypothetical protein
MRVIRTESNNSWQGQLGNLLGTLIGANLQQKDMDKRYDKMQNQAFALDNYKNSTQEDWLKNHPELVAVLQNPNMTDDAWDNLSNKHGLDTSKFKDVNNFHRNIMQAGLDYNNAADDIGRNEAHKRAEELRGQFAEKWGVPLKGFSKDDNITEDTLKETLLPLLTPEVGNLFESVLRNIIIFTKPL